MHVVPVSEAELNRSAQLYRRLGELSAEMSQLPTERSVTFFTQNEAREAVSHCKDALIDALFSAVRLAQLEGIDETSRGWIEEALRYAEEDQAILEHVEQHLVQECLASVRVCSLPCSILFQGMELNRPEFLGDRSL